MKDSDTGEVLLNNDSIKNVNVLYGSTQMGTSVYLSIQFKKEYKSKFEEISKTYIQTTDEEGNEVTKAVMVSLDEDTIINTYFGQTMRDRNFANTNRRGYY